MATCSHQPPTGVPTQFKVVLLGEGRVGKTSLVSRFVNNQFSPTQESTVQANMYSKKKVVLEGSSVDLSIWDTAGQERFHALGPIYYRNAAGAVLVYDITDADTLEKVKIWVKELKQVVGESIQLVICGNKGDLEKDRAVAVEVAEEFARIQGAKHFTTSAKTNLNVEEAFTWLARAIVKAAEAAASSSKRPAVPKSRTNRVKIDTNGSGDTSSPSFAPPPSAAVPDVPPTIVLPAYSPYDEVDGPKPEKVTLSGNDSDSGGGVGKKPSAAKKKCDC